MSILIEQSACAACGSCTEVCPGNLIKRRPDGTAYLKHPEECWGCASCLKKCRHAAISYFLGADIGGRGSLMQTKSQLEQKILELQGSMTGDETADAMIQASIDSLQQNIKEIDSGIETINENLAKLNAASFPLPSYGASAR